MTTPIGSHSDRRIINIGVSRLDGGTRVVNGIRTSEDTPVRQGGNRNPDARRPKTKRDDQIMDTTSSCNE